MSPFEKVLAIVGVIVLVVVLSLLADGFVERKDTER